MESNKEIEEAIHDDKGSMQTNDAQQKECAGEPSSQEEEAELQEEVPIPSVPEQLRRGEEVAIDVELVKTIGGKLQVKLGQSQISKKEDRPTIVIPRVPERLRKGHEDAYEPSVVSIGPYHRDTVRLQPMQIYKWRFLGEILRRYRNVELDGYIKEIASLENQARSCYPEDIGLEKNDFVELLLLDGCFIVGLSLQIALEDAKEILDVPWRSRHIESDLLLLENQIPFFILECIYKLILTDQDPLSFPKRVIESYNIISGLSKGDMPLPPAKEIHHLLHLYHKFTLWSSESNPSSLERPSSSFIRKLRRLVSLPSFKIHGFLKKKSSSENVRMVPSATQLNEAGVKLKLKQNWNHNSILDVSFNSDDGVMEIPPLLINHLTNSRFRNLIAFEQLYPKSELKFTEYVKFLNYIIHTPRDVALLYRRDIIVHPWGHEKDVVHLFNSLARDTTNFTKHYLHDVYEKVDRYCKRRRHRHWATLVQHHFSSPWSVISLAAAAILLLLTFLQTYCSMYFYFHQTP